MKLLNLEIIFEIINYFLRVDKKLDCSFNFIIQM
jgi:hypothetical protein